MGEEQKPEQTIENESAAEIGNDVASKKTESNEEEEDDDEEDESFDAEDEDEEEEEEGSDNIEDDDGDLSNPGGNTLANFLNGSMEDEEDDEDFMPETLIKSKKQLEKYVNGK